MERFYSFIVPVYNRPGELAELLQSLVRQNYRLFEVVIVEDGSDVRSDALVKSYADQLTVQYIDLPRSGPSVARNAGTRAAIGDYFIYVDSDCILPVSYLHHIDQFLESNPLDFFGGPDQASDNFSRTQKAISYAMTSFLTTGGVRGGKKKIDKFYPRSFNMGVSRKAFETVGGFPITRMHPGEDMVFSIELIKSGFASGLIRDAFVYHKRRTTLGKFFKQVFGFGKTRVMISKVYPDTFRIFYLAPALFLAGTVALAAISTIFGIRAFAPLLIWMVLVFLDASWRNQSLLTGAISVIASLIQLYGYGWGFIRACWSVFVLRRDPYGVFAEGFYAPKQKAEGIRQKAKVGEKL